MEHSSERSSAKVEGLADVGPGLETYPLDSLLIRTEQRAVIDVLRRVEKGFIKLDPDFQRELIWDEDRQSRLIESVLMRIPLPVFYFAEDEQGSLIVVDGLQRLSTLTNFNNKKLALTVKKPELEGKRIDQLAPKLRNRFEDGQLTFYIIDAKVPDHVRLDIFERVNAGVPLTRQQMRNALYNGPATRLLRELAAADAFLKATGKAISTDEYRKEMRDREAVNRFVAFAYLDWKSYAAKAPAEDMDDFMGRALRDLNKAGEKEINALKEKFLESMQANHQIFGDHAFRKHKSADDRRSPFNVSLFDVFSVIFARHPRNLLVRKAEPIRRGFYKLMSEKTFVDAISSRTTSPESVRARFEKSEAMMGRILGADAA